MSVYYLSIGNSDDKLRQHDWSCFVADVAEVVLIESERIHGQWFSASGSQYQNACWCFEATDDAIVNVRAHMAVIARRWEQDSIALAKADTEFIQPLLSSPVATGGEGA